MGLTDHKLKFVIDADGKAARKELVDIDRLIGNVGSGLGAWAGPAAIGATAIAGAAAGIGAAGVALFNLTKQASDYGSTIFDASKKTGLHAESLSAMDFAAKQSGTSLESITGGIAKFAKNVGAAADDTKKATKFLEDFGITPQAALADLDGALGKVFKRIIDAPPGIERMTLAQKAFGKSGADLLPFIDSFDGDLGKLIKKAKELGVTIDDEAARAADEFGDQLDTLSSQLASAGRAIGFAFMEPFTDMAKGVSGWLASNKDEIAAWGMQQADTVRGLIALWGDYHQAVTGGAAGGPYRINAAGKRESPDDWSTMFGGALGVFLRDRGTRARMDAAGSAFGSAGGTGYELDPVTHTVRPRSTPISVPRGPGEGGGGSGKTRRPPHETDSEFRKFFTERGFGVNRTFGGEINKGSLHPSGQAADVSIKGKSVAEIFALTAAALEKGYRLFDERVKRPGVKQTGPHLHFERGGSLKDSSFLGADYYGGGDQLAYLQALDAERRGKASGTSGLASFQKDRQADADEWDKHLQQVYDDWMAQDKAASDDRLSLRQEEADQAVAILDDYVENGYITEKDYVERIGELKLGLLEDERAEVAQLHSTKENTQRLAVLDLKIETQKIKNATAITDQANKEAEAEKKVTEEYWKQINALQKKNQRPYGLTTRESYDDKVKRMGETTVGSGQEISAIGQLHNYFVSEGNTAAIAGVDAMTDALGGMGQALGSVVQAWVLYGSAAGSASEMTAQVLAGIAQQATVKAVFELAEGFAMLALAFFGHPGAGPSATQHFIAAGIYASLAGGAALAGRAAAGDSFKKGGAGGRGSSSSTGGQVRQEDLRPISRVSDDAYTSGHRDTEARFVARAIEKLTKKIEGMRPGDVVAAGFKQRKGIVATQFNEDIAKRPQLGAMAMRKMGAR